MDVRFERSIESSDDLIRLIIMVLLLFDSVFTDTGTCVATCLMLSRCLESLLRGTSVC